MGGESIIGFDERILVTGSNGLIGHKVVEMLVARGYRNIRCFTRPTSNLSKLEKIIHTASKDVKIEVVQGNLLVEADCEKATEGVSVIYHLSAGSEKSFAGMFMNTVVTTRNLLEAVVKNAKLKRILNVSSFAVYSNMKIKRGGVLDESCEIESKFMERFEAYCYAKVKQDEMIIEYAGKYNISYAIVRPGAVYGPGVRQLIPPRVGSDSFGVFMNIGGYNKLPLTYLDNCADAIILAGLHPKAAGEVFNIVDDELLTSRNFLRKYKQNVGKFSSIRIPFRVFYLMCYAWEKYSIWSKEQVPPVFNRRKCAALWKGNRYSNEKLKKIGWIPKVSLDHGLKNYFEYLKANGGYKNA